MMTYIINAKASHQTKAQEREELRDLRKVADKINKTPKSANKFLIENGFITKSGQLSKRYR